MLGLHDLVLSQSTMVGVHGVTTTLVQVLDVAQTQRPAAVLISLKLVDGGFGGVGIVEANNTAATRAATRLVLDFGLLDLADSREQLNEIVIARRPRKLGYC